MKVKTFALLLTAALLCGCGSQTPAVKELPEDTPYNRSIMETEKGYYTNGDTMFLRFYERDTENQIYLCAKPECLHDGSESCVATYNDLECIDTVLYDGALYILTLEKGDPVELSLYKAALDGTSITKVGDAFTVGNPTEAEYVQPLLGLYFIIHKGYAYIPYRITVGSSPVSFASSGLVKMNISDGSTEQLYTGKDYFADYPNDLAGSGDYVWFNITAVLHGPDSDEGLYVCNVNTGEIKRLTDEEMFLSISDTRIYLRGDDEISGGRKNYSLYYCDKEQFIEAPDSSFTLFADGFENVILSIIPYKDMVILACGGKIYVYNEDGEKLGDITYYEDSKSIGYYYGFAVSNDKIYITDDYVYRTNDFSDKYVRKIYSCPLEDILNGTGEWKFEYGIIDSYRLKNTELFNNAEN